MENSFKTSSITRTRATDQFIMPLKKPKKEKNVFDIYPAHNLGRNKIQTGFNSLAKNITHGKTICLDGFSGIEWSIIIDELLQTQELKNSNINLIDFSDFLKSEDDIKSMLDPFLGEEDSLWGRRCTLSMNDFFDEQKIIHAKIDPHAEINIIYGFGSSLANLHDLLIYFDFPKNELQYLIRSGSVKNFGLSRPNEFYKMYKHYYFIEWVVMNEEKKRLGNSIDIIVDAQHDNHISWAYMEDIRSALKDMSSSLFRVRPWFEPGAWGGEWIKDKIKDLNPNVVNYAWAFSLIVPENGILFESNGNLLEISFDFFMNQEAENILGEYFKNFGNEFPIRFNFLDTYRGGNLSIQCHPSLKYIKEVFGENLTQDECYYIMDCEENASVYLGFQEDINPVKFKNALLQSEKENVELEITDYVQRHDSKKHDFYLIPNGTVHSAGSGNMVLEISATPYIFTFKMYDWLRLDLNGKTRPINIEHAFNNLNFERKGEKVGQELFSKTSTIEKGNDYEVVYFPTHRDHFYDVRRLDFDKTITRKTQGSCQVMMLVEGESILVETQEGQGQLLNYSETFVIPAATKHFTLTNKGKSRAKVINAYLK